MIALRSRGRSAGVLAPILGRVSLAPVAPDGDRARAVRVCGRGDDDPDLRGYAALLTCAPRAPIADSVPTVFDCDVAHLADGDVVRISPSGDVETLYRRASPHNTILATERCNSYCVMCSQPPRAVDDGWRVAETLALISLVDPETRELGISGGEPTLWGGDLLRMVEACRDRLPSTSLHILSNGRRFMHGAYANALGAVRHPDLMLGIPLYADVDTVHDYVVQARGAFNETMLGFHNLARAGVPIEVRVVLHRDTFARVRELARFIYRNLTFSAHVAFMGLEIVGFARANLKALWADPADYAHLLEEAVLFLASVGIPVSVYNHQLCTVPPSLWPFARRAISDWKAEYAPECGSCTVRFDCGGFFAWNLDAGRSRLVRAI